MDTISSNHDSIIELYRQIDQAFDDDQLDRANQLLESVYSLCDVNPLLLQGLAEYIHEKVSALLDHGTVTGESVDSMVALAERAAQATESDDYLLILHALKGRLYCETDRNEAACEVFRRLAEVAEAQERLDLTADAWHGLGVSSHYLDRYQDANYYLQKSAALYGKLGQVSKQAYSLYVLGMSEMDAGSPQTALLAYEQAAAILLRIGDFEELARVWHEQSLCYLEQGLFALALAKSDQVIQFHQEQKLDLGQPLLVRVQILFALGEIEEARALLGDCFPEELDNPDNDFSAILQLWQGILTAHSGELQEAVSILTKTASFFRNQPDYDQEAFCRCLAGLYLWLNGETDEAETQWQMTVDTAHLRIPQPWMEKMLWRCLDRLELDLAKYGSTRPEFGAQIGEALRVCGFTGDDPETELQ